MQVKGTDVGGGASGQKLLSYEELQTISQQLGIFNTSIGDAAHYTGEAINQIVSMPLMISYMNASAYNKDIIIQLQEISRVLKEYAKSVDNMAKATEKLISTHRSILEGQIR